MKNCYSFIAKYILNYIFNLKIIFLILTFLILNFYSTLILLYTLKYESTFLIVFFSIFFVLLYFFVMNRLVLFLNDESFLIYYNFKQQLKIKKLKIKKSLVFGKKNQNLMLNKLNLKILNRQFLLSLINNLNFNNLNLIEFFYSFFLVKFFKKEKK